MGYWKRQHDLFLSIIQQNADGNLYSTEKAADGITVTTPHKLHYGLWIMQHDS
jgi:hypothetical protein